MMPDWNWNLTGTRVAGKYCGKEFVGTVDSSRVKFGGEVQHTVDLDTPIEIYGETRTSVLVGLDDLKDL